jgi:hypothetical protein
MEEFESFRLGRMDNRLPVNDGLNAVVNYPFSF